MQNREELRQNGHDGVKKQRFAGGEKIKIVWLLASYGAGTSFI
jgi:hypothetical protein